MTKKSKKKVEPVEIEMTRDDVVQAAQQLREEVSQEVTELRDKHLASEAETFRAALVKVDGYVSRAAKVLGIPRSRLSMALLPRGRHAALGVFAAKLRAQKGWYGGRPPL